MQSEVASSRQDQLPIVQPLTGDQLRNLEVEPIQRKPMPASNKKPIVIGAVVFVLLLLVGGGVFAARSFFGAKQPIATPAPVKKKIVEPTNVIPMAERPVVHIKPEADGRNLTIEITEVKKPADTVEYELEYQAGELLQGVQGAIELTSLPAKTTQLMGSCSAGGKCSYHTDVKGGSLLLRFISTENYALKQDWKYIENKTKETAISSKDAKFQLESPELAKQKLIVIYNSPGYPEEVPGTVVSEVYSMQSGSQMTGKGKLTIRANEEGELVLVGYDGKEWITFESAVDGKMVSAEVELMQLYAVVKK